VVDESTVLVDLEVNAFRILPEAGRSYFLDFIHYSPARLRAVVVGRLRVHEDALRSIRERLTSDLVEMPSSGISVVWEPATPASGMVN
jgi:hypothetical protein